MKKMFMSFDFISPRITLFYKGQLKHSSIPSVFISIISVISITILSIIFSLDFILRRNPTAFYYNRYIAPQIHQCLIAIYQHNQTVA